MSRRVTVLLAGAGLLLAAILTLAATRLSSAVAATPTVVDCARAEARRNFNAFKDYQCDLTSYRKTWTMDGKMDRDVVVVKKLYVKPPKKKELFVSGTLNGQAIQENDLYFERLGLADSMSFTDIEVFRAGNENKFQVEQETNPALLFGTQMRVLKFTSLAPGQTNLQTGRMFLPMDSCRVVRIEGKFVQRTIINNTVDFTATLQPVTAQVWLPMELTVKGIVSLGIMKRRMDTRNIFANYRVNTGLTDAFFH